MELNKNNVKYQTFRRKQKWDNIAQEACHWVNTKITVARILGITSNLCHFNNEGQINIFYNDTKMQGDIFEQANKSVLCYEIFQQERVMMSSWKIHNQKMIPDINKISQKGNIVAINSLQNDQNHKYNLTIVWYTQLK